MSRFHFDERNAADYADATERIRTALATIARDQSEPATKANLARLSGLHRNTLYRRALGSAGPEQGWPFTELALIADRRRARSSPGASSSPAQKQKDGADPEQHSRLALEKSRFVAASWFRRSIQLKQERDEARRQVELLTNHAAELKEEVTSLRQKLRQSMGVIK